MNTLKKYLKKPWVIVAIVVALTLAYGNRLPAIIQTNAKKLPGAA